MTAVVSSPDNRRYRSVTNRTMIETQGGVRCGRDI